MTISNTATIQIECVVKIYINVKNYLLHNVAEKDNLEEGSLMILVEDINILKQKVQFISEIKNYNKIEPTTDYQFLRSSIPDTQNENII